MGAFALMLVAIAALLATSGIFLVLGWTDISGKAAALTVGCVVAIAASISGDTSQDLKTGFLLGATPRYQQIGELIEERSRAAGIEPNTNTARFMVLSLAFACSCGGMGTLVGGGRNMVAAAFLKELTGVEISFLDWIKFALPIALVTVPAAVLVVYFVYRPDPTFKLPKYEGEPGPLSAPQKQTIAVVTLVFLAWLTHGLPGADYSVTGMIGVAAMVVIGVLKWDDIHHHLEWGTALFIFGGGIGLGLAMASSGAASFFAHQFFPLVEGKGWLVLLAGVCVFGALVTNAMANVAAAALILPIVIPLAELEGVDPRVLALGLACATSFAMLLVIGCPPNAIAYSYRQFKSIDLTRVGLVATPVLLLLMLTTAGIWWSILGLL